MITVNFSPEESQLLENLLETYLSDLKMEIRHTDNYEYKQMLKQQQDTINRIVQGLKVNLPIPATV